MDCKPTNLGQRTNGKRRQFSWWWILHSTQGTYEKWNKESNFLLTWKEVSCFCRPRYRKKLSYTGIYNAYKKVLESWIWKVLTLSIPVDHSMWTNDSKKVLRYSPWQSKLVIVWQSAINTMQIKYQSRADEATRRTYGRESRRGELLFDCGSCNPDWMNAIDFCILSIS